MKKTILAIRVAVVVLCFTGCFKSDEPCELCGNTPTQGYQGTDGVTYYVCERHTKICSFCGDKATHHFTWEGRGELFVCDGCYKTIKG